MRRPSGGGTPPSALVRLLLRLLVPEDQREFFLGDLQQGGRRRWLREIAGAVSLRISHSLGHARKRPTRGDGMLRDVLMDLRFGLRLMGRSRGFTLVALLTLAVGIGANTAMFSILNGVVLRPLPYPESDRIVVLYESYPARGWPTFSVAPLNLWDWQERTRTLDGLAGYRSTRVTYTGGDHAESLTAYKVEEGFLEILGAAPAMGRSLTAADVAEGAPPVVVVTDGFWHRAFGGDPDILGRTLTVDGLAHTVIGVLPPRWRPFTRAAPDLILPLTPQPWWYEARGSHFLRGLGHLRPGVTVEETQADFSSMAAGLAEEHPDTNTGWSATVRPLSDQVLGSTRPQLLIFMACVALVLLIACANLANMMLARASTRGREMAIRVAVGAGRRRVLRQLLVESLLLATVGGVLGIALAYGLLGGFAARWPALLPRMEGVGLDPTVLLFSAGASLAAGVLFGLLPALSASGNGVSDALRRGGRGLAGSHAHRWVRGALVAGEVAMAVMLLVGTGLLVRSFNTLEREDPGFRTADRLVLSTPLNENEYGTNAQILSFTDAALPRIRAVPGVRSAAVTSLIPMSGDDNVWGFWLEGNTEQSAHSDGSTIFYRVTPEYFDAMGLSLVQGRAITAEDREDAPGVAVISQSFADRYFPGKDPVGQRLWFNLDDGEPPVTVVGVVGDVQHYHLGQRAEVQLYVPFRQRPTNTVNFAVRTSADASGLAAELRRAIRDVNPNLPVVGLRSADALVTDSISLPRFRTFLMSAFGMTALLLALVGLYGVLAYNVAQRTKEFGVRVALGAARESLFGLVFRQGLPLVATGVAVGLAGALALSRILESMLFGVDSRDPVVFSAVSVLILLVAAAAMFVPAHRATRVDPVRTLAEE